MSPTQNKQSTWEQARGLALLSHISIVFVFVLGPFCVLVPFVIWQLEKGKENPSKMLLFQSKQAFYYQLVVMLAAVVLGVAIFILTLFVVGLLVVPLAIVLGIAALAYGIYAGIKVWQGEENFKYYYLGDYLTL